MPARKLRRRPNPRGQPPLTSGRERDLDRGDDCRARLLSFYVHTATTDERSFLNRELLKNTNFVAGTQIRLFPHAYVLALGNKAKERLVRAGLRINGFAQHPS